MVQMDRIDCDRRKCERLGEWWAGIIFLDNEVFDTRWSPLTGVIHYNCRYDSFDWEVQITRTFRGLVSHPEIFEFQDVIKIKIKTTIFSQFLNFLNIYFSSQWI